MTFQGTAMNYISQINKQKYTQKPVVIAVHWQQKLVRHLFHSHLTAFLSHERTVAVHSRLSEVVSQETARLMVNFFHQHLGPMTWCKGVWEGHNQDFYLHG